MSGVIAKLVGKKILGETLQNQFGTEDPYFEHVPATRLNGTPTGKFKKKKKALPPGITEHDAKVLTKVKRRAYRLDNSLFTCCGVKFGWGSVIGLVPAVGDVLDTLLSLMVFRTAMKVEDGVPPDILLRMLFNVIFDFVIGIVPVIGDLADAAFRANTRNAAILEGHLRQKGKKSLRKSGLPLPDVDPSLGEEFDRLQREDPPAYTATQPGRHERMTADGPDARTEPPAPAPARVKGQKRGFFGRSRASDVEMGQADGNTTVPPKSKQQRRS